jgi:hypothetical protein
MHAEAYAPYRETAQLLADVNAELGVMRDAHARALQRLLAGPESPPPMSTADAARALLAGDTLPTAETALGRLQFQELEIRQRLQRMEPVARQLVERVGIERDRARRKFLETEPRMAQLANGWASAESAVRAVLALEAQLAKDIYANSLGSDEFVRPLWLNESGL